MSKWTSILSLAAVVALSSCSPERDMSEGTATHEDAPYGRDQAAPVNTTPDNTAMNERDRDDAMPTPMDQGQSEMDLAITQSIRRSVIADESLSMDAKNAKIITLERAVALRGPVASEDEKARVGRLAENTPNVVKVFNLLEVKPATTH